MNEQFDEIEEVDFKKAKENRKKTKPTKGNPSSYSDKAKEEEKKD